MGDEGPLFFFHQEEPEFGWLCQWCPSRFTAEVDGQVVEFRHAEQLISKLSRFHEKRN
jgi:hypothetical protein